VFCACGCDVGLHGGKAQVVETRETVVVDQVVEMYSTYTVGGGGWGGDECLKPT
jgi:hypothetical protein